MTQQRFLQETKLGTMKLPNLVTQKSSSTNSLVQQQQALDSKPSIRKSFEQKGTPNLVVKTEPSDSNQDEILEMNIPESQIRRKSQFGIQQMKRMSGNIPQAQSSSSYNDLGNVGDNNNDLIKIDLQQKPLIQFESPRAMLGMSKKHSKNIAQDLITPLKMQTPNRYNTQFQKIDQSLSEFLDFNQATSSNKERRQRFNSKNLSDQFDTPKNANDQLSYDASKVVLHDFIVMGKELFAAGTNNGFVQIWKYKEFKFSCIFQIQAHYSPVKVASTNVSGIIFSYGFNQKGQNSVKIWNNDTESSLTEIIEILELHPAKSAMTHLISLAEVFKGSQNNVNSNNLFL